MKSTIERCLNEASKHNTSSIAFPTLGTGSLKFPEDITSSIMMNAVYEFSQNNPSSSLKVVNIVIYDKGDQQATDKLEQVSGCHQLHFSVIKIVCLSSISLSTDDILSCHASLMVSGIINFCQSTRTMDPRCILQLTRNEPQTA